MTAGADLYTLLAPMRISASDIASSLRSSASEDGRLVFVAKSAVYLNKVAALAKAFGVSATEMQGEEATSERNLIAKLIQAEHFIDRIYAQNIADIEPDLQRNFILLNDAWQTKAT